MAAPLPFLRLFPAEYLADTQHLTTEQHGAYFLLILNYWQTGKALDNTDERLYIVAGLSRTRWKSVRVALAPFFKINKNNQWRHGRIEYELSKALEKSHKTSYAGQESARKKKNRELTRIERKKGASESTDVGTSVTTPVPTDGQHLRNKTETDTRHQTQLVITPEIEISFEEFWLSYPKQPKGVGSKKSAKTKYAKITQTVDPGILLEGLNRFILTKPDVGFIPYVTTWLNGERWNDEVLALANTAPANLPHAKTTDLKTGEVYCQNCGSAWPCLTESKKGGPQF